MELKTIRSANYIIKCLSLASFVYVTSNKIKGVVLETNTILTLMLIWYIIDIVFRTIK